MNITYSSHKDGNGVRFLRTNINGQVYEIERDWVYSAVAYKIVSGTGKRLRGGFATIAQAKAVVAQIAQEVA